MADIFGVDRQVQDVKQIANGAGVMVQIGGKPIFLVQQVDLRYQRQINAIYELGSEDIYAGTTSPQGTCTLQRAVGHKMDALEAFETSTCESQTITLAEKSTSCAGKFGMLEMQNALLQEVGIMAKAGEATVTENAVYWIGSVEGKPAGG